MYTISFMCGCWCGACITVTLLMVLNIISDSDDDGSAY